MVVLAERIAFHIMNGVSAVVQNLLSTQLHAVDDMACANLDKLECLSQRYRRLVLRRFLRISPDKLNTAPLTDEEKSYYFDLLDSKATAPETVGKAVMKVKTNLQCYMISTARTWLPQIAVVCIQRLLGGDTVNVVKIADVTTDLCDEGTTVAKTGSGDQDLNKQSTGCDGTAIGRRRVTVVQPTFDEALTEVGEANLKTNCKQRASLEIELPADKMPNPVKTENEDSKDAEKAKHEETDE